MDGLRAKILNGFAWEASMKVVSQLASWSSTVIVARLLTPSDYGIVAISGIFVGMSLRLAGMGLGAALINKQDITTKETSNVFWLALLLSFVIYAALYILAPVIAAAYEVYELEDVIQIAGFLIILGAISMVSRALLMRALAFKVTAIVNAVANLVVTISAIIMAYSGFGYWSLIYSTVLGEVLMLVCFWYCAPFTVSLPDPKTSISHFYRYGLNILLSRMLDYLNGQWPIIVAGQALGKVATGYFQMAYTIAALPLTKIGELFYKIVFPSFSRIQHDRIRAGNMFLKIHRYLLFITLPMFLGIYSIADELVIVALGEKWSPIIVPIKILSIVNLFMISAQVLPRVLEGVGNSLANVIFQSICAVIFPIVMFLGVTDGLNSMLLMWLASIPICYCYLLIVASKDLSFSIIDFIKSALPAILAGVCMVFVCLLVGRLFSDNVSVAVILFLKMLFGASSYFIFYYLIRPIDIREFISLVKNRS